MLTMLALATGLSVGLSGCIFGIVDNGRHPTSVATNAPASTVAQASTGTTRD